MTLAEMKENVDLIILENYSAYAVQVTMEKDVNKQVRVSNNIK